MGKLIGEAKAKGEDIEPLKAKGEQIKNDCAQPDASLPRVQASSMQSVAGHSQYSTQLCTCRQ